MGAWRRLLASALVTGRSRILSPQSHHSRLLAPRLVDFFPGTPAAFQGFQGVQRRMSTTTAASSAADATSTAEKPLAEGVEGEETKQAKTEAPVSGEAKVVRRNPVSWLSFFLLVATAAALLFVFEREKKKALDAIRNKEMDVKYGPSVGKAAIGGPFKLVNHEGKTVTEKDFLGNWTLMYFGFTSCPDICPDELQKMVQAIDAVDKKSGLKIAPLFVSVDPERDSVEQMKEYVQEFHPRLVGLTGAPEDIKQVAKSFRVYYMKTGDEGDDYLVDHSIIMYLMDPKMEFVKFFGKNYTVDELSQGIMDEVKNHGKTKRS
ncbi:protein SCO1 homolog 1, mitochondrial [Selaginella moellendorffii]|nr:protein SCO1 homolog 1, mitochondrial [Selaginella moellendorffii]|eukprot:XP_002982593.2 protein SCO1 homolog 1, mitochondrial [Selaginella moellendorffii]